MQCTDYPGPARLCRLLLLAVFGAVGAVCVSVAAWSAHAQAVDSVYVDPVYMVRDIRTSETGATGREARTKAVSAAQVQAFDRLLRRLTPKVHHDRLPRLSDQDMRELIVATDVQRERITATAYQGVLALAFDKGRVRRLLRSRNIPFIDWPSPRFLIVPVYLSAGAQWLWELPNPWADAWAVRVGVQGLLQIAVPRREPSERLVISADQALVGDRQRLQTLAQRYDARGIVVAVAEFQIDPGTARPMLKVTLIGYGVAPAGPLTRTFVGELSTDAVSTNTDRTIEELTELAAADMIERLAEAWKERNVQPTGGIATSPTTRDDAATDPPIGSVLATVLATMPLSYVGDYASAVRQLRQVPAVESAVLTRLSIDRAVFRLNLRTNLDQAQRIFSEYGMSLTQQLEGWLLRPNG